MTIKLFFLTNNKLKPKLNSEIYFLTFIFQIHVKNLQRSHDTGSDTSAETIGSDSGRGGSESDMPNSANPGTSC